MMWSCNTWSTARERKAFKSDSRVQWLCQSTQHRNDWCCCNMNSKTSSSARPWDALDRSHPNTACCTAVQSPHLWFVTKAMQLHYTLGTATVTAWGKPQQLLIGINLFCTLLIHPLTQVTELEVPVSSHIPLFSFPSALKFSAGSSSVSCSEVSLAVAQHMLLFSSLLFLLAGPGHYFHQFPSALLHLKACVWLFTCARCIISSALLSSLTAKHTRFSWFR